jgi:two-component system chemotaxis response regulator CheY
MLGGPKLHNLNVLVVDDNKFMCRLLENLCRGLGIIRIYQAGDAESAIEILGAKEVDLLITDWHMSPMDGLDLVKFLRTDPNSPNAYVPIIMLTGHGDRERVCEARDAGCNMFMAKPVSAKALYERLIWMINNPLPFIKSSDYFGPDRRRRDIGPPEGVEERRADVLERQREAQKAAASG